MKINEINQPKKINEGAFLDLLLGPELASKYSKQNRHAEAERLFLDDFIDDATVSLNNGIKSGLVDPNLVDTGGSSNNAKKIDPNSVTPSPTKTTAPGASAAAANKAQQQTSQNINNYVRNVASEINKTTDKNQKIALTKELVNAMADRQGTPEWNNAIAAAQQIVKRSGAEPNFVNAAINNLKSGKTMTEAWRIYFVNKLLESINLTWDDLGLCVLKEGKNYYFADKKYTALNYIFESIMETDGVQSITSYMTAWFDQYMQGVDWRAKEKIVLPAIKEVEKTYQTDQGKSALEKLGRLAFALSGPAGQPPAGAKDIISTAGSPARTAPSSSGNKLSSTEQIITAIGNLKDKNPKEFKNLVDQLKSMSK
jgi:hypothetical protein